jgi:hypothetical protein
MSDGIEMVGPEEGPGGAPEEMSEQAKQRFAGIGAALRQIQKEEKQARKRDDSVAQVILQFLTDSQRAHFSFLIATLVGRNCPSIFILGLLSLINEQCLGAVQEYLKETQGTTAEEAAEEHAVALQGHEATRELLDWITRLQLLLSLESEKILDALFLDEKNMDGSVLQLTSFVLQEYFMKEGKSTEFEKVQPLAASILQSLFAPYLGELAKRKVLKEGEEGEETEGETTDSEGEASPAPETKGDAGDMA